MSWCVVKSPAGFTLRKRLKRTACKGTERGLKINSVAGD